MIGDVQPGSLLLREEIFGPVAALVKGDDEQQVIEQANNTIYGLASYFYSNDAARIWRVSGAAGIRHGRHQYRADFQRSRAVWRGNSRVLAAKARNTESKTPEMKYLCRGYKCILPVALWPRRDF